MPDIGLIVIVGFMGCGKTQIARALARRLNAVMIDLDDQITKNTGRSPAQLIVEDGEAAFRAVESETLRQVLEKGDAKVISLGGGAWIQEDNRELIEEYGGTSVWLDAPFETCWARIEAAKEVRPLGRTRDQALALYHQRWPVYASADVRIPVRDENADELIRVICGHLIF